MNIKFIELLILVIVAASFVIIYHSHKENRERLLWQDHAQQQMQTLLIYKK